MRKACSCRIAVLLAVVLSLACVLSTQVIERLHDHECTGRDCAACHTLEGAESALLSAATSAHVVFVFLAAAGSFVARTLVRRASYGMCAATTRPAPAARVAETPVSLKVLLLI